MPKPGVTIEAPTLKKGDFAFLALVLGLMSEGIWISGGNDGPCYHVSQDFLVLRWES